jgi:predicted ABC-type ATPase
MSAPIVIVLGGPNGSGKSTAAVRLLRDELQVMEFVNADQIAQGLSAFRPEVHAIEAGRVMLEQLKRLIEAKENFAFETTLASRTFAPMIREMKEAFGYSFRLIYLCLENVELNLQRIAARVDLGGHSVPEETVRRRYERSIQNLFDLYLPLADRWEIYDNTQTDHLRLIVSGAAGLEPQIFETELWKALEQHYDR